MTEFTPLFRDDELDEEDLLLRGALANFQSTVTDFMARTGKSMNDLTESEQRQLVSRIDPHLNFEMQTSKDIYRGMPVVITGAGAFMLTDQEGFLLGMQVTSPEDVITGTINSVQAYPVPTREIVLNTAQNDAVPMYDRSLSAVIVIEDAKYYSMPTSSGEFQITHDLGAFNMGIPTVYNMNARVADTQTI